MILSVGLIFLLQFAGLPTGASLVWLGLTGSASDISSGAFFIAVGAMLILSVGGIVIGYFTKSSSESFIVGPIASGIFAFVTGTFIAILNYTSDMGWIYYIIWMIFVPLLVGFGISIIKFWRGTD
jgi:uncharacterized membrane protein (UPF0136 family)